MNYLDGKRLCNWPEYQFLTDLEAAVLDEISSEVLDKAGITLEERQKLAESLTAICEQQFVERACAAIDSSKEGVIMIVDWEDIPMISKSLAKKLIRDEFK